MDTLYMFTLRREYLNKGGYTSSGRYFGTGEPLYYFEGEIQYNTHTFTVTSTRWVHKHIRATNREDAKAQIKALYPQARFYR